MRLIRCGFAAAAMMLVLAGGWAAAAEFTVEKTDKGVTVKLDGKLFTEYLIESGKKPALWPIIGPTGKPMTRAWPIDKSEVDAAPRANIGKGKPLTNDHPHHRSMWFGHQRVNGVNVWLDGADHGSQKHREFREVSGGKQAKITTINDWLDKNGKKLCEDERTITCSVDGDNRVIDFDVVLKATAGDLVLGDEKDALFAVRVPDSIRVEANQGGRFINSEGKVDERENPNDARSPATAWGKPAAWIDYHGPVDGEILGIAILNHPSSYGFPTHWHTRNYGLFAANPFGLKEFKRPEVADGTHTVKSGDTLPFRYRVIFHKGDEKVGRVAETFAKYAQEK